MRYRMVRGLPWLAICAPFALLIPTVRHFIESRMALHMLLEFPMLFAAGLFAAGRLERLRNKFRQTGLQHADHLGITGLSIASCVFAFWMIPAALDMAILHHAVAASKYASWWLAGWLIAGSIARATPGILLFFFGNAAWMSATVGLLYLEAPARLCVNYQMEDQTVAGLGLLLLASALTAVGLVRAASMASKSDHGNPVSGNR